MRIFETPSALHLEPTRPSRWKVASPPEDSTLDTHPQTQNPASSRLPSTVSDSRLASSPPSNQSGGGSSEHQTYPLVSQGQAAATHDSNFPTLLTSDVGSQPIGEADSGAVVDDADHGPEFGFGAATQTTDGDSGDEPQTIDASQFSRQNFEATSNLYHCCRGPSTSQVLCLEEHTAKTRGRYSTLSIRYLAWKSGACLSRSDS